MTLLPPDRPALFLAPMQDVTDLPFLRVMAACGGADVYVTEYFRVYENSPLNPYILRSVTENPTARPVIAQMIGQHEESLVKTVNELKKHPVAGIDLNLGCPAPVVYRKDAGGGLLRKPEKVDRLLGALREACGDLPFTVKTRVGFESPDEFDGLLGIFKKHAIDLLTIHGRTVRERYQTPVHPEKIRQAVEELPCPVIANGNVVDVATGLAYLKETQAAGLMIGRGAIRHPWIFPKLRAAFSEENIPVVSGRMVLDYITMLYEETGREHSDFVEAKHVQKMKRYLVYIVQGHVPEFEHAIRRVKTPDEFFSVCREFLDHDDAAPELPSENSKLFCGFSQFL
ncbi:tRNA-dihydrouridine synthase family protein [Akkermansiaceae bacterium]|nr:tRNA-dihydrouridine synthase family protein [Akkermansiaceae bacterium]